MYMKTNVVSVPRVISLKVTVFLNESVLVNDKQGMEVQNQNRALEQELIKELNAILEDQLDRPVSISIAKNPVAGKGFLVIFDELGNVEPDFAGKIMGLAAKTVRQNYDLKSDMKIVVRFGPLQKEY